MYLYLISVPKLDLLRQLYQKIIIPPSVFSELAFLDNQKSLLEKEDWIELRELNSLSRMPALLERVDRGEAEAIVLALELKADLLLIDEQTGRGVAEEYGLKITGVLGILVKAKREGLIPEVKTCMEKLRDVAGFRIHPKLFEQVLSAIGE